MYKVHGRFINEDDFTNGKEGYERFIKQYISLFYEPLVEEYDEARYFTKDFDDSLLRKIRIRKSKKLTSIELK